MYLKKVLLENVGPIDSLEIELPFNENSQPKPVIIVGENGSGKSIFLSYIVNALLFTQQELFDNCEVEKGKVYKKRSPSYIKVGSTYSFGKIEFEEEFTCFEWQLNRTKKELEEIYGITPIHKEWNQIPENESSFLYANFNREIKKLEDLYNRNCLLYFPANRFEEPAWLNWDHLNSKASFSDIIHIQGFLNRKIINYSPLNINKNWLLDILYDRSVLELNVLNLQLPVQSIQHTFSVFTGYNGESTNIYNSVLLVLKKLFQKEGDLRFGMGKRNFRNVELIYDEKQLVPNIFQLSTGETALLNLFLTILRDYDLCPLTKFESLDKIRGLVLIDEIDIHLHSLHQRNILPELISLFPGIQFIITSHSPLFILGLEEKLGSDGFRIIELPKGIEISSEQFSEFEKAYSFLKFTKKYDEDIRAEIERSHRPIVFGEGTLDIRYLKKAAEFLGKKEFLEKLNLKDFDGYKNMDNFWNNPKCTAITPQKIILLYDCDTKKNHEEKKTVFRRIIPFVDANPIKKGIENLFKRESLEKALKEKSAFIDITREHTKTERGQQVTVPETWEVNKDEKKNLCDWFCNYGTREDFESFIDVFKLIEEILT
ncbi:AAA family ATPase [Anabaena cylindrica FACHB-243]|uniref:AAA ATPase n=1 Tax=Anabaena cylindrica (strain ATCC 27899 / PCC 7122) TaxID=272123 RepID=K9ZMP2_ANACC|nr:MULTISPECIES: AAA family ATPase [Anabaena]AFZ59802.1 AAA ATPase [Anabaena cylindrica PCC 7122]MBD2417204.1 AAA family ATPase [Anabaena cylindrica FACHB-243]MBY5282288.1 AAA family ATPase [Anabaena sp. CCAP 1446/1C]MBY5309786.1 AAA family ATPase [Anabaena sp. CCAP 1446/1C]MCM2404980.1 AAA family ATPase [Anabaena sp. CCAP 1446/1C]